MQTERSVESILFEAEFWRHATKDMAEMAGAIETASKQLIEIPITMVELSLIQLAAAMSDQPPRQGHLSDQLQDRIAENVRESLKALETLLGHVHNMIRLADGRYKALREEVGLPPNEGDIES